MPENLPNISVIFPDKWFEDNDNAEHPLFGMVSNTQASSLINLQVIDSELGRLRQLGILHNSSLKEHLQNSTQFMDTFTEIHVALHLATEGLKPEWGKDPPDIIISELDTDIEVKNLKDPEKLKDSGGKVVELDDMYRIEDRIVKKVLRNLNANRVNLIVLGVVGVGFDEFEDLFVFSNQYQVNPRTLEVIRHFEGLFSSERYDALSAVVMMKDPFERWLNPWRRTEMRPGDAEFRGLLNPRRRRKVPQRIARAFNIVDLLESHN